MSKTKTRGPWHYHEGYKLLDEFGKRVQTTTPDHYYLNKESAVKIACRYMLGHPDCQEITVGGKYTFQRDEPIFNISYKEYVKNV